jgi:hypothetical protein
VSRKIIDFYGIEHLSVNLTGDKNALIYPDLMEKNGHHAVPDYDYDACYNRSVYLLRRAGFNVVEKPGLEMAAASINQSKGRTFVITPEMFAAEAKNKKGRA